jgi:hypothetical protein
MAIDAASDVQSKRKYYYYDTDNRKNSPHLLEYIEDLRLQLSFELYQLHPNLKLQRKGLN